jgi:hypothetical protein
MAEEKIQIYLEAVRKALGIQRQQQVFEIEINLPKIIKGPIRLEDGNTLDIGDRVEHPSFGIASLLQRS